MYENNLLTKDDIISGEKIQKLADIFCGVKSDFEYNSLIKNEFDKCIDLEDLYDYYNNPYIVFCYSHSINILASKLYLFKNPFILITHNSDTNITEDCVTLEILETDKIIKWFCQNKMYNHPKLYFIPIGIANSMWPHGNLDYLMDIVKYSLNKEKINDFYFNFSVNTNRNERELCKNELIKKGLQYISDFDYYNYLKNLSTFKFAICPPGNGVDCHRIWECYYLGVIPILKRSIFTEEVSTHFPCIILDQWTDFDYNNILNQYSSLSKKLYESYYKLKLSYFYLKILYTRYNDNITKIM